MSERLILRMAEAIDQSVLVQTDRKFTSQFMDRVEAEVVAAEALKAVIAILDEEGFVSVARHLKEQVS